MDCRLRFGGEMSVLSLFDDGWAKVKVLRRSGSTKSIEELEGFIPIDCSRPKGNKGPLFVGANAEPEYTRQVDV